MLSEIASFFDPLGFFAPIIIQTKIFMQKLWLGSFDWDDRFPDNLFTEWSELKGDIMECPEMEIPRRVGFQTQFVHVSLHVFSDASDLRTVSQNGQIWVHLITSKTRVVPLWFQFHGWNCLQPCWPQN